MISKYKIKHIYGSYFYVMYRSTVAMLLYWRYRIGEVTSGAMRLWQPREKDVELETEMLLKLMVFLGSDSQEAIDKIQSKV